MTEHELSMSALCQSAQCVTVCHCVSLCVTVCHRVSLCVKSLYFGLVDNYLLLLCVVVVLFFVTACS